MATFDFPYHEVIHKMPDDQARVRFGRGFVFTSDPAQPIQRTFVLMMYGIQWTTNSSGVAITGPDTTRCAKTLYDFYLTHRMGTTFDYPLPGFGTVKAKFNKPLEFPSAIPGGTGVLPPFEIELIEVPA